MADQGESSTHSCNPPQDFFAVYVRKARRQKYTRLPRRRTKLSHIVLSRMPDPLSPAALFLVLLGCVFTTQAGSAVQQDQWETRSQGRPIGQRGWMASTIWSNYQNTGLHCRSGRDGSSPDLVAHVRAQLYKSDSFSHIETTFWPREEGGFDATMMYRVQSRPGFGEIREARATIHPETCEARLISVS